MRKEQKEREIDLGGGAMARQSNTHIEIITLTNAIVLTMNQARRLAAVLASKMMRN